MEIKLKRVPFNVDLAKKITEGKINGAKITTFLNRASRILSFDVKGDYPIAVAITQETPPTREVIHLFNANGESYSTEEELCLCVPVHYNDYSNFRPQKWQPCLVRNNGTGIWIARVASELIDNYGCYVLSVKGEKSCFNQYLPISKLTLKLLGTTKSYEELLEEKWTIEE